MNQLEMAPATKALLDRIRHSGKVLSIFEMPADLAEAAVFEICRALLDNQSLPMVQRHVYQWFLREVAKLLRTKTGWDLALELEICLRKWSTYNLDPRLMQALLQECCVRIEAMTPEEVEEGQESTTKTPRHNLRQMTNDEVQMTSEARSPNAPNDGRRTSNEPTMLGAGNG